MAQNLSESIKADYIVSEYSASLANGASLTHGWIDTGEIDKYQLDVFSGTAIALTILSSSGPNGTEKLDTVVSTPPQANYNISVIPRLRYININITNNTGAPLADCFLGLKEFYGSSDKASSFPLSFSPFPQSLASLHQAVITGRPEFAAPNDPYIDVLTTDDGQLIVANGKRLSQVSGRAHHEINIINPAADTVLYTVPAGWRLYVTSTRLFGQNTAVGSALIAFLRDGAAGAVKGGIAIEEATAGLGGVEKAGNESASHQEPVLFEASVYWDVVAGSFAGAVILVGYLELI